MTDWKLIALDLDGTLLNLSGTVSSENQHWIRIVRDAGIEVTIATGRMRRGMVPKVVELLGLTAPIVTGNGGEVWTANGQLLERHPLALDDVCFLRDLANSHDCDFWASGVDFLSDRDNFPNDVSIQQWIKFGFRSGGDAVIQAIWKQLRECDRYEVTNSHPLNIEVNVKSITKAHGLQRVCYELGISPSQVVAIGDSLNDVSMLRWAGLGIATRNAQAETKQAADWITAHCLEDGVAEAIKKLLTRN